MASLQPKQNFYPGSVLTTAKNGYITQIRATRLGYETVQSNHCLRVSALLIVLVSAGSLLTKAGHPQSQDRGYALSDTSVGPELYLPVG